MPYSQFNIETIQLVLGVKVQDRQHLFSEIPAIRYSDFLAQSLEGYNPLAIDISVTAKIYN